MLDAHVVTQGNGRELTGNSGKPGETDGYFGVLRLDHPFEKAVGLEKG
jgi:hypothetical protein